MAQQVKSENLIKAEAYNNVEMNDENQVEILKKEESPIEEA
jgi:hypothetical protein